MSKASKALHITQPTLSKQIRLLEEQLDEPLFERRSRQLHLTDAGQVALDYAEEIFNLGNEFMENMQTLGTTRPRRLKVGISVALPKIISHQILAPILDFDKGINLICEEDRTDRLLADLSIQQLDLVLADSPIARSVRVKAYNHFLGDCGVAFFAAPDLARQLKGAFPKNLNNAPFLVLTDSSQSRRSLDRWFEAVDIQPQIRAEFEDTALMKVFGRNGAGVFAAPRVIASQICEELGVEKLGYTEAVRDSFYAITIERKYKHSAVAHIAEQARTQIFGKNNRRPGDETISGSRSQIG